MRTSSEAPSPFFAIVGLSFLGLFVLEITIGTVTSA